MDNYFADLIGQSIERTAEATLGVLGITDAGLRAHIGEQMRQPPGKEGSPLADPVFEHTFGWHTGEERLDELPGSLLDPDVLKVLTEADNDDYRFDKGMKPYRHQIESWRTLREEPPRSLVVTTGTGSGKTECFMVPILDDLVCRQRKAGRPLVGVGALFLYPLNALINSQQERLDAWTESFGDRLRFCLYNGDTEELESQVRKTQVQKKNQVLSREVLRRSPPPILMTNATMLEYMLVRQRDEPIVARSRENKSLRWIVLDEAHTYVGSQAAELSLLLRRVIEAFGARAEDIRFVATSATLSGADAEKDLQRYLALLAGVPVERVVVVGGKRAVPPINRAVEPESLDLETIAGIEPDEVRSNARHAALCRSDVALALREALTSRESPPMLSDLQEVVRSVDDDSDEPDPTRILSWLDLMTGTETETSGTPFAKLRVHLFQRMVHGLWSCVDPDCSAKTAALEGWPFGCVFVVQRDRCTCGGPVLELGFCKDCSASHLLGEDHDGTLRQPSAFVEDEFSLLDDLQDEETEDDDTEEEEVGGPRRRLILGPRADGERYQRVTLDLDTAQLSALAPTRGIEINLASLDGATCATCGSEAGKDRELLRKAHLGAPFHVANAVPTVLEHCADATKSDTGGAAAEELPARGRRLITFSDSRQGTARLAVRMQQDAERSRLRGLVYRTLRNAETMAAAAPVKDEQTLRDQIAELEKAGPGVAAVAAEKREELEKLITTDQASFGLEMPWRELIEALSTERDMNGAILDYNRYVNPTLFGGIDATVGRIARVLLAREYARRPKHQNSTETLGLVRVGYVGLEDVTKSPPLWEETRVTDRHGLGSTLTLQDWKDFLKVALDFYVRENTFVALSIDEQRWMGSRFAPKTLLGPKAAGETSTRVQRWPLCKTRSRLRIVRLLALGAELDPTNPVNQDRIDRWLQAAWVVLCDGNILSDQDGRKLNLGSLTFSLPRRAWICSLTHRLLDTTFRGFTPYLPRSDAGVELQCEPVRLPDYSSLVPSAMDADALRSVRQRVGDDERVRDLRSRGLWTELSDRVVEGGYYYRTAEHSAQQSQKRLRAYEDKFKTGRLNVLNCSTTMEMGVDIGGVSAVVMNNVPPHPANYLQRAGRAGRRSEPRAIAYTICRNHPHDQRAFAGPMWPFVTPIRSPDITLDSKSLVQRHVHSMLLAMFLRSRESEGDNLRLKVQWFYGGKPSTASRFVDWMKSSKADVREPVRRLVRGTVLKNAAHDALIEPAVSAIESSELRWQSEDERLSTLFGKNERSPYGKALKLELSRHRGEYLLRDLAVRGFLPGYGFPTDVVSLRTYNVEDFLQSKKDESGLPRGREDNVYRYKEQPSRGMAIALREYAPGAQIVVDGRVHRSAGVALHWHTPGAKAEEQKFDIQWRCLNCGTSGFRENAYVHEHVECLECGRDVPKRNWKVVLQPAGFVTDFFESTTNDVSSQTFIRMQRPVVSVEAPELPLANPRCGSIRYGDEGHVFVHSSGKNENGYAVCLKCGRAESMTPTGDVPSDLAPGKYHKPIGGPVGSSKKAECSGEGVKSHVFLGHRVRTDVLELAVRNPITEQWLGGEDEAPIIASTLALALRECIAERLGIASTEMGYAARVDRDRSTGQARAIAQVHDITTGGAGFVLTAADDMPGLLRECLARLDCPRDCDNVCPACLAGGDGRVERDELDRKETRRWLIESGVLEHMQLPERLREVAGATAWMEPIERFVDEALSVRSTRLVISVGAADLRAWTFDTPELAHFVASARSRSESTVAIVLPSGAVPETDQMDRLRILAGIGAELRTATGEVVVPNGVRVRVQVEHADGSVRSLLSIDGAETITEERWTERVANETLAVAESVDIVTSEPFDPGEKTLPPNAEIVEFTDELNGPVRELPQRFGHLLRAGAPGLHAALEDDPVAEIEYSDRYLCSPWSAMLLATLLESFPTSKFTRIRIKTSLRDDSGRRPLVVSHDWRSRQVLSDATRQFFEDRLDIDPTIDLASKHDVGHRRALRLRLESGRAFLLSFDHGMGYWRAEGPQPDRNFDFGGSALQQARAMHGAWKRLHMINLGKDASDISIQRL